MTSILHFAHDICITTGVSGNANEKGKKEAKMFEGVEVLVDLQTGAISVVVPGTLTSDGGPLELECVTADDQFAPQE